MSVSSTRIDVGAMNTAAPPAGAEDRTQKGSEQQTPGSHTSRSHDSSVEFEAPGDATGPVRPEMIRHM